MPLRRIARAAGKHAVRAYRVSRVGAKKALAAESLYSSPSKLKARFKRYLDVHLHFSFSGASRSESAFSRQYSDYVVRLSVENSLRRMGVFDPKLISLAQSFQVEMISRRKNVRFHNKHLSENNLDSRLRKDPLYSNSSLFFESLLGRVNLARFNSVYPKTLSYFHSLAENALAEFIVAHSKPKKSH